MAVLDDMMVAGVVIGREAGGLGAIVFRVLARGGDGDVSVDVRVEGVEMDDSVIEDSVLGSGFASLHNFSLMRPLMSGDSSAVREVRAVTGVFNKALTDAVQERDPQEREKRLLEWRKFPRAYDIHPRHGAEHFMPLLVCAGAGGDDKAGAYKDDFSGVDIWSYYWS